MKSNIVALLAVVLLTGVALGQQNPDPDELWGKGDPESIRALAQLHAEDADIVFYNGEVWRGRNGIERGLAKWIAASNQASAGNEVSIQTSVVSGHQINDDVTLWDGVVNILGPSKDGPFPTRCFCVTLMKRGDGWPIAACKRYTVPTFWKARKESAVVVEGGISEEKAVEEAKEILDAYVEAYNAHRTNAVVSMFTADATAASAGSGVRRVGERIRFWYDVLHFTRNPRRINQLTVQSARFLTPEVLIADSAVNTEHLNDPDNKVVAGQMFTVFVKTGDGWRIKWLHYWSPYVANNT